jgi:hypothetical protein
MAQLIDYTPGPVPGSYSFLDGETGKSFIMDGIEAERTARGIDAQKMKGPDMRVAGPGGGENMSIEPAAVSTPPAPVEGANMMMRDGSEAVGDAPTQNASAAPAQETPPEKTDEPRVYAGKGGKGRLVETRPGHFEMISPGTKGVSQKDNERADATATKMRASARDVVEGAFNPDEDYINQLYDTSFANQAGAMTLADVERERIAGERKVAAEISSLRQVEMDEAARKKSEIETRVENERLSYDSAIEGVRGKKVNSNRLFSGTGGKMRLIGLAIANGFAGYSSAVLGRPNDSWQIINGAIDRDIAEQEHEIMQGNKNVDNALSRLTRSTGSLEQAKILLKNLQHETAMAQAQDIASKAKSQEVDAKLDMFLANEKMRTEAAREEYLRLAYGKHTAAVDSKYAHTRAGTGPTRRPATIEETKDVLGVEKTSQEFRKTNAEITKTLADAEAAGNKGASRSSAQKAADAKTAGATQGLNNMLKQLNLGIDPKTGKVVKTGDDIPGVGLIDSNFWNKIPGNYHSRARQTIGRQFIGQLLEASGLTVTDAEVARHEKVLFGDGTEGAFLQGVNNIVSEAKAKAKARETGEIPEIEGDEELPEVEHVN